MKLLRVREVEVLDGFRLRLTLTDGSTLERDVAPLMTCSAWRAPRAGRLCGLTERTCVRTC